MASPLFIPSPFASVDDGTPTSEYGIWFDDGTSYDWAFDSHSLTFVQAAHVCRLLNAEIDPYTTLDTLDFWVVDYAVMTILNKKK